MVVVAVGADDDVLPLAVGIQGSVIVACHGVRLDVRAEVDVAVCRDVLVWFAMSTCPACASVFTALYPRQTFNQDLQHSVPHAYNSSFNTRP